MDPITKFILVIIITIFVLFFGPWVVKELWNGCLVSAVDGVHEITYWQAFGLSVLTRSCSRT